MILKEQMHDTDSLTSEAGHLERGLNPEQRTVCEEIIYVAYRNMGRVFFIYGSRGTGKTYLWRTLISKRRLEGHIVIAVASSGIVALLLQCARTIHSRFKIPIKLDGNSCCNIPQGSELAFFLQRASLIIWDEDPMMHRHAFEAVDRTFRDIMKHDDPTCFEKVFGGKTIVLGKDFRQILPVVPRKGREDIVDACICKSPRIWPNCTMFQLHINMILRGNLDGKELEQTGAFGKWVLHVGDGHILIVSKHVEDKPTWIHVPEDLLLHHHGDKIMALMDKIYPDLLNNYTKIEYLTKRSILAPKNECVDSINEYILSKIHGQEVVYKSADKVSEHANKSGVDAELYPTGFLTLSNSPEYLIMYSN